jgi:hypothetical protein
MPRADASLDHVPSSLTLHAASGRIGGRNDEVRAEYEKKLAATEMHNLEETVRADKFYKVDAKENAACYATRCASALSDCRCAP